MTKAKIKEIFTSIQGEGNYIGYNQLFIRFCGCNLKCDYCDTDFYADNNYTEFEPEELAKYIDNKFDLSKIHSISLTGGEPLLSVEFLKEFLPLMKKAIYLETNGTLFESLIKIKPMISIIAADIKLESASGKNMFDLHDKFFQNCAGIETFAKIVFNENINNKEIDACVSLVEKYGIPLVLQPQMINDKIAVKPEFIMVTLNKFLEKYKDVRVIPQTHKFLNID